LFFSSFKVNLKEKKGKFFLKKGKKQKNLGRWIKTIYHWPRALAAVRRLQKVEAGIKNNKATS
jgi:hypothetical protein